MIKIMTKYLERSQDNRKVGVSIHMHSTKSPVVVCSFTVNLFEDEKTILNIELFNNHSIVLEDERVKDYDFDVLIDSISGISMLADDYLNKRPIKEALRVLNKSEKYFEVYSEPLKFALHSYVAPTLHLSDQNVVIRIKRQSILPILNRLVEGKEVDISRYRIVVGSIYDEITDLLGIRQSFYPFPDYSFITIIRDGTRLNHLDDISISKKAIRRKRETNSYFLVSAEVKKAFSIQYAKRVFMKRTCCVTVNIDDDCEIIDVSVKNAPKIADLSYA